ncbi:MAG: FAD-dependent oxidoreductase, partial [Planctomycetota bacterium]
MNRRMFLGAAGAAVADAATGGSPSAVAAARNRAVSSPRRTTIAYNPDVLVVGGGPAGIGAALGAAWHGAKTLLIEHHAFFGGVA